jgi:hypothetical protein
MNDEARTCCHPVRSAARSGALQTRDLYGCGMLQDPVSARRHFVPQRARDDNRNRVQGPLENNEPV